MQVEVVYSEEEVQELLGMFDVLRKVVPMDQVTSVVKQFNKILKAAEAAKQQQEKADGSDSTA